MIKDVFIINDRKDFKEKLELNNLAFKACWENYDFKSDKINYYRLVLFDNGEYGLFTQSQLKIVKAHQELNSSKWKVYQPYADPNYPIMRATGVVSGSAVDKNNNVIWTPIKKAEFRETSEWKAFRRKCLDGNMVSGLYKCDDCKQLFPENEVQVHHIVPDYYNALIRIMFKVVCKECHDKYTHDGL